MGEGRPMIADQETNVVFVADTLELEFPAVYSGLRDILGRHEIPLRKIPGTRSIWCRDYMPIQVSKDRFVQFRYAPDYLTGKYRHLRADGQIGPGLLNVKNCERSEIVLDGGNVVGGRDWVIVCDKVFAENPGWAESELIRRLGRLLEVEQVIVIPTEPGDVVGHSDGVVRFGDGDVVLVNDYRNVDARYQTALRRVMKRAGLEVVKLPYCPKTGRFRGIPSAFGCYINYLRVGQMVVVPRYGLPEDTDVLDCLQRAFLDSDVRSLDCSDLSREGGVLRCATWGVQC
jgi:agmatine deiminase